MPFKKGEKPPEKKQYVEKKDFDTLLDAVNNLASLMTTQVKKTETPEESKQVKEVEKAGPNKYEVDSDWEEIAKEIIGEEFLDHTELERKGGGIKFTIVIKVVGVVDRLEVKTNRLRPRSLKLYRNPLLIL